MKDLFESNISSFDEAAHAYTYATKSYILENIDTDTTQINPENFAQAAIDNYNQECEAFNNFEEILDGEAAERFKSVVSERAYEGYYFEWDGNSFEAF